MEHPEIFLMMRDIEQFMEAANLIIDSHKAELIEQQSNEIKFFRYLLDNGYAERELLGAG